MQPYIKQTIADLTQIIAEAQNTIKLLHQTFGASVAQASSPASSGGVPPPVPTPARRKPQRPHPTAGPVETISLDFSTIIPSLPPVFDANDIETELKRLNLPLPPRKAILQALYRAGQNGDLKLETKGSAGHPGKYSLPSTP